jgi:hypothetical protein
MKKTPLGSKHQAGHQFELWAWVELNYRPHAYQAATEGPGIRHHNGISLTDRAICPDCRREVPWLSGINRHHNRHHLALACDHLNPIRVRDTPKTSRCRFHRGFRASVPGPFSNRGLPGETDTETAPGWAASVTPDAHPSSDAPTGNARRNSGHARAGVSDRHSATIGFGSRCFDPGLTRLRR